MPSRRARGRGPRCSLVRRAARLVPRLGLGAKPSLAISWAVSWWGGGLGAAAGAPHPGHTTQGMHVWQLMGFIELSLQRSNLQIVPSLAPSSTPASMRGSQATHRTAHRTPITHFWHWLCAATRGVCSVSPPRRAGRRPAPSGSTRAAAAPAAPRTHPAYVLLTRARSLSLLPQVSRRALSLTKTPKAVSQRAGQRSRMSSKAASGLPSGRKPSAPAASNSKGAGTSGSKGGGAASKAPPIKAGDAARAPAATSARGSAMRSGAATRRRAQGRRRGAGAPPTAKRVTARAVARGGGGRQGVTRGQPLGSALPTAAVRPRRRTAATRRRAAGPAAARRSRRAAPSSRPTTSRRSSSAASRSTTSSATRS